MVTDCSIETMGSVPNLPVKRSVSMGTMLNFDGDEHGHGDRDGTCIQAFEDVMDYGDSIINWQYNLEKLW